MVLVLAGTLMFWQTRRARLEPPAVLAQIKRLNQLATVRYSIQRIVGIKEEKQPLGSESILLIVQARVDAGINLDLMRPQDVTVGKDGSVSVRLPPPRYWTCPSTRRTPRSGTGKRHGGRLGCHIAWIWNNALESPASKAPVKRLWTWAFSGMRTRTREIPSVFYWNWLVPKASSYFRRSPCSAMRCRRRVPVLDFTERDASVQFGRMTAVNLASNSDTRSVANVVFPDGFCFVTTS